MPISELLQPDRIACQQDSSSKKRCLETLSTLLAGNLTDFTDGEIFNSLIGRERLGSTGLGNGVALPHGRIRGLKQPIAALVTLKHGIDFDAIDRKPVDLLFALLVPEESTDEHLQILAQLASLFSDPEFCSRLRNCNDSEQCFELINNQGRQQLSA
ncbi:MAG TPA: PTS IIA-like nitrogen-regulatory protein PtsN [Gammaproteobacteria bacterium]|nr:PTS IIA-like nitrogen-regulatory protein PtsN [Gammaproteobacteria bacterium]